MLLQHKVKTAALWSESYIYWLCVFLQINIFQKPSFLHQLTHNMTRDSSLNYKKNTIWEHVVYKNCFFVFVLTFKTVFVHNMYFSCNSMNSILWVNWFKNESIWHGFTCTKLDNVRPLFRIGLTCACRLLFQVRWQQWFFLMI